MGLAFAAALAVATGTVTAAPPPIAPGPPAGVIGVWANPKGTLAVRTQPCGRQLCGTIVWANAGALRDAREAGVERLVGTALLQGFRPSGRGLWAGRVWVPDMGRSFSSRIRHTAPDRLTISGCLVAGFLCRSQEWRRLS